MGDLKTLKNSSILRSHTTLLPERKNATRWYSLFNMLVKWNRLRQIVSGIDFSDEVSAKIPTPQENASLLLLINDLKKFESVSKILQSGGDKRVNLYEVRMLFDSLLNDFHEQRDKLVALKANSTIVKHPHFENGIVKRKEETMSTAEKAACRIFLKIEEPVVVAQQDDVGYAESILSEAHRIKRSRTSSSRYRSTLHVASTSNICERLFSQAKLIMSALRKSMKPDTLNMLLLLKANRSMWPDARTIQTIINSLSAEQLIDDDDD